MLPSLVMGEVWLVLITLFRAKLAFVLEGIICIWEVIKGLQRQNTEILSFMAFQVILGFNVLIHLDLLILTQWKFISWKLKSDLRGKIQISFQNPADMSCHQDYSTQKVLYSSKTFITLWCSCHLTEKHSVCNNCNWFV